MIYGYARVSTSDQNLDRQQDALYNYGIDKLYCEKLSGTKKSRPELDRLLKDLHEGDTIVIESLSRLGRSVKNLSELMEIFNEKNIRLVSLKETIDTTSSTGRLLFTILSSLAQFERGLWDDIFPRPVGKDEVKGVLPGKPHGEVIRSLGLLHLFENIHDEGSGGKRPCLVIFGGSNVMLPAFFFFLAELLLDRDRSLAEVDGIPRKPADLALSHACKKGNREKLAERFTLLDRLQERRNLALGERFDLLLFHAWEGAGIGRIESDIAELQGLIERLVENAVDVLDGLGA